MDKQIRIWDARKPKEPSQTIATKHDAGVTHIAFRPSMCLHRIMLVASTCTHSRQHGADVLKGPLSGAH